MDNYREIELIGKGSYGKVYKVIGAGSNLQSMVQQFGGGRRLQLRWIAYCFFGLSWDRLRARRITR